MIHNEEERERTWRGLKKNALEPGSYDHFLVAEMDGKVVGRVIFEAAYPLFRTHRPICSSRKDIMSEVT